MSALAISAMAVLLASGIADREVAVRFDECGLTTSIGFLGRVVETYVGRNAVHLNAGSPQASYLIEGNAGETGSVIPLNSLVCSILAGSRGAQFREPIVLADSVSMVDAAGAPLASHVEPSQDVRSVMSALANLDDDVSADAHRSGDLAGIAAIPILRAIRASLPTENTGFGIVIKDGLEKIPSDWRAHVSACLPEQQSAHDGSHGASTHCIGD